MLRVATYNLELGGRNRETAIGAVCAALDADILALTEADDREVVARLAATLGMYYVWERGSGERHIATLSRYPILETHIYNRPPLTQAVLESRINTPDGPLTCFNVHFLPFLLFPFELRRWQAAGELLRLIATRRPGPHLLLGDFNAIAPGDRVLQSRNPARMRRMMMLQLRFIFRLSIPRLLRAGYTDCFRTLHPQEDGFTWWTINPTTRYDYIFADRILAARLRSCRVVEDTSMIREASDHFPLIAEFVSTAGEIKNNSSHSNST